MTVMMFCVLRFSALFCVCVYIYEKGLVDLWMMVNRFYYDMQTALKTPSRSVVKLVNGQKMGSEIIYTPALP